MKHLFQQNLNPRQFWRYLAATIAIAASLYRIFGGNRLSQLNYLLFPCQAAAECKEVSAYATFVVVLNIAVPALVLLAGLWFFVRNSRIAGIVLAASFGVLLARDIGPYLWINPFTVHTLFPAVSAIGLFATGMALPRTLPIHFHKLTRNSVIKLAIAGLILMITVPFAVRAYMDTVQVNRIIELNAIWESTPEKLPSALNSTNAGRQIIKYGKGKYTYSLCGNFATDLRMFRHILPDSTGLGATSHGSGDQCFSLKPKPELYLKTDYKVQRGLMITSINRTSGNMMIWTSDKANGGNPYIKHETIYYDTAGRKIPFDQLKVGNVLDFYWMKDAWEEKDFAYKGVITAEGPAQDFCEKSVLPDASSSPLCPQTTTDMSFQSMQAGVVTVKDSNGKKWHSYYFEHPAPQVQTSQGQVAPSSALRVGQKVDLIWVNDVISVIRLK